MQMKKILFKSQEYLLLEGGAITTPDDYANWRVSFAHYYVEQDAIKRYNEIIGSGADIKVLEELDDPGPGTKSDDGFMDSGWFRKPTKATVVNSKSLQSGERSCSPRRNMGRDV